jgi:hypothetical protein
MAAIRWQHVAMPRWHVVWTTLVPLNDHTMWISSARQQCSIFPVMSPGCKHQQVLENNFADGCQ